MVSGHVNGAYTIPLGVPGQVQTKRQDRYSVGRVPTDPPPAWTHTRRRAIGSRLREARTAAGLSQERLADMAGVDRKTIVRLESGTSDVRLGTWLRIARAVGVPLADLVRE
ncbi:helix-turn-helix transcriptional regulator [Streptomyces sp. NPDC056387]|uniref:helix-turn-helix transcriptional regulator n=1 Tax=Streptomyces sp. NPDC056387 TaxID=3345803 RepID=UPI0035E30C56